MKKYIFVLSLFLILGAFGMSRAEAAHAPELFLNGTTGSTVANITIMDADPNAPVSLYYSSNGSTRSISIGTTNASGNLSATVDASTYGIVSGSQVYAGANGASSPSMPWPDYSSGGSLALSSSNLSLKPGQTGTITVSVSADLTIGSNSAPSVATVSISGREITVQALASGSDSISICATGLGCSTVNVNVASNGGSNYAPATFTISTTATNGSQVTLGLGQSLSVPITGNASNMYSVKSNSNPSAIGASANGTNLYLTGTTYGGSNVEVCEFEGSCTMIYAYVPQPGIPAQAPAPKPLPAVSTPPAKAAPSPAIFKTYLKPGSVGLEVRALQTVLAKLGFLKHVVTGFYGKATVDAVAALQAKHNLAALGVVGPATRALLNSLLK